MDWITLDVGVRVVFPGLWVVISMLGMFLTLIGSIALAMAAAPVFDSMTDSMVYQNQTMPVFGLIMKLDEEGALDEGDLDRINEMVDFSGLKYNSIRKLEKEGDRIYIIFDTGRVDTTDIEGLMKFVDKKEDDNIVRFQNFYVVVSAGLIIFGFGLQLASMIARHFFVIR